MSTPGEALVRCRFAGRRFGPAGDVHAVVAASCAVHRGDRIAVVGRSGSGKSTLLHLMAGLDRPTSGDVEWPAAGRVGLVFQGPNLHSDLSAQENVVLGAVLAGATESDAVQRARDALDDVGIAGLGDQMPGTLSAGQAQRVAIARVLAARPALILADEPTARLDRTAADRIVRTLIGAADVLDAALVVATHDESVAGALTQWWSMTDGRLLSGTADAGEGRS